MNWKANLEALGWKYVGTCSVCGGSKHNFKRGNDTLVAYPNRNFYTFTENGKEKSGNLSNLPAIIKSLQNSNA